VIHQIHQFDSTYPYTIFGWWRSCVVFAFIGSFLISTGCGEIDNDTFSSTEDSVIGVGIPTDVMVIHSTEQHGQLWCWAASAQMALSTQRVDLSQESIVRSLSGGRLVDRPGGVGDFLALCGEHQTPSGTKHVTCEYAPGPPPLSFLIHSLNEYRPVILGYQYAGSDIGHAVVVTAIIYRDTFTGPELIRVIVRDPAPSQGKRILSPEEYQNSSWHAVFKVTPS
jgi:hypothetical protein